MIYVHDDIRMTLTYQKVHRYQLLGRSGKIKCYIALKQKLVFLKRLKFGNDGKIYKTTITRNTTTTHLAEESLLKEKLHFWKSPLLEGGYVCFKACPAC